MIGRLKAVGIAAGLACGFAVSAPANAALIGASVIHIEDALAGFGGWLQIAEVIATQFVTGTDVAASANGGTAFATGDYGFGQVPANAIDGVFPASDPNIFHSDTPDVGEYLEITLAAPADLKSLTIYGRSDCCQERDIYNITIFNAAGEEIFAGQLDNRDLEGGPDTIDFGGAVPEPASLALLGAGLFGLAAVRRRKQAA